MDFWGYNIVVGHNMTIQMIIFFDLACDSDDQIKNNHRWVIRNPAIVQNYSLLGKAQTTSPGPGNRCAEPKLPSGRYHLRSFDIFNVVDFFF